MVVEQDIQPFLVWLFGSRLFGDDHEGAFWTFGFALLVLAVLGVFIGFLRNLIQYGMHPFEAFPSAITGGVKGVSEVFQMSPRRLYAMSWLAFQESIGNRATIVGFAVFTVIMLILGWYLDAETDHPARLYISIILPFATILLIILSLFLSVFSLPHDIEDRTIYTIVTKPVFSAEIVFGRILGFGTMCTLMLVVMGIISYFFVVRGLEHTHTVDVATVKDVVVTKGAAPVKQGQTSLDAHHRHEFTLNNDGEGLTNEFHEHKHFIKKTGDNTYEVGPPEGMLQARVPVYARRLRFLGRDGKPSDKGINVGEIWTYRGYIEGGTGGAAIWTFPFREDMFPKDRFPKYLPLELNLRVFRTYKGDIEHGILGSYMLKNPDPKVTVESNSVNFTATEFETLVLRIPRKINGKGPDGKLMELDVFKDLAPEGFLDLYIMCGERAQYYGAARADVYFRAAEGSFVLNFIKSYIGIWVMMLMVLSTGVMFSTFVNTPIALLATAATLVFGYFKTFIVGVALGTLQGGGPVEALVRLAEQRNLIQQYDPSIWVSIMQWIDLALRGILLVVAESLPSYGQLGTANYVAYGFDIPFELLVQRVVTGLAFVFVTACIGYLFLRGREIAG